MKKLLAMLLVLMLALPCAAFAEPSTAYTIALGNPVISYMDETLDMTGLDLELSGIVSDFGQFAITLLANVGPAFENTALNAQAQLDSNGLTFSADGMNNVYSLDLTQYTNGFDVTTLLPMLSLDSMLKEPIVMESTAVDLSLPVRYNAVSNFFAEYSADGAITIDRTQGELMVNQLLTALETAASSASLDGVAELRTQRLAFDMNGTLTSAGDPAANNGSYTLTGNGNLYNGTTDVSVAYDIAMTDSAEAINGVLNLYEPDGTEIITLTLESNASAEADGRVAVNSVSKVTLTDSADASVCEEMLTFSSTITPVAGSNQMDYVMSLVMPSEETDLTLLISTGTNGDDIGFSIDLFMNIDGTANNLFMYYTGAKATDSLGTAITGKLSLGGDIDGMNARFDTDLLLRNTAMDTTEWVHDSSAAIAIETMDEAQNNTALFGVLGIVSNAMSLISEHVPGLAPLLEAAAAGMM